MALIVLGLSLLLVQLTTLYDLLSSLPTSAPVAGTANVSWTILIELGTPPHVDATIQELSQCH